MAPILLFDSSTGELAEVRRGDAIRVEVHTADLAGQNHVDVASTRPFVVFSLLRRLLDSEGLPTEFLFNSNRLPAVLQELRLQAELMLEDDDENEAEDDEDRFHEGYQLDEHDLGGERDLASERDLGGEYDLGRAHDLGEEGEPAGEGACVEIRFGAARSGEPEWAGTEAAATMTLTEAIDGFGHQALIFYLLGTHYSEPLGDPVLGMSSARQHLQRVREALAKLHPNRPSPDDMHHHLAAFREALATDLDTPAAIVSLFEWLLEAERRDFQLGDEHLRWMLGLLELADVHDCRNWTP